MRPSPLRALAGLLALALTTTFGAAATLKWSGMRNPCKISAGDGVTKLDTKIGKFLTLADDEQGAHAIFNVHNRFPGSTPWVTVAVGVMPETVLPGPEAIEKNLARMDDLGVAVFLELMPVKTNDVVRLIDQWLGRFKHHQCVRGLGIDLEFYQRVDDTTARSWDEQIKRHKPAYRMFLKHWDIAYMPPAYRGRGDLIFIDTSSEAPVETLNAEFKKWAAHFAPSACAFQIGYPADEDSMDGKNTGGWWRLADPIKDWGQSLLAGLSHPTQEIGLLWVCAKSGKTYNPNWDLTKGATLPARKPNADAK